MLVLTRKLNERIVIADSIVVTIVQVNGSTVKIGIDAPKTVSVLRQELLRSPDPDELTAPTTGLPVPYPAGPDPAAGQPGAATAGPGF